MSDDTAAGASARHELAMRYVRRVLREKLHLQSLALTAWIARELTNDPRLSALLDRLQPRS